MIGFLEALVVLRIVVHHGQLADLRTGYILVRLPQIFLQLGALLVERAGSLICAVYFQTEQTNCTAWVRRAPIFGYIYHDFFFCECINSG